MRRDAINGVGGLLLGLLLVLLAAAMLGCGGGERVPPELAVLDHTGSSRAGSTELCARQLMAYATAQYGGVSGKRGELRVDVFDPSTAAEPTFPVRETFVVPTRDQSSPDKSNAAIDGELEDLSEQLGGLRETVGPSHGGTDVVTMLTSLGEAARAIGAKRIWMCSDFADNRLTHPITHASAMEQVRQLKQQHSMPDLTNISLIIDTSSRRGRIKFKAAELAALREFARELIKGSGGSLLAYGPGAVEMGTS